MKRAAQRKQKRINDNKKGRIIGTFLRIFIPIILIASVLIFLKYDTQYWNWHDKFAFVTQKENGDIAVTVLDPVLGEETVLTIPGETEVEVARNYGTLRIKNVWQLGVNEKLGGSLLAQTITNNFTFPVFLWWNSNTTNIPLGDRLFASIFMKGIKEIDRTEIDLGKSEFLHKAVLNDGSSGYKIDGQISSRLTVYFSDNTLSNKNEQFGIMDATGADMADNIGAILEVLGGKVVSTDRRPVDNSLNCLILGKDLSIVKKVSNIFSCQIDKSPTNFDLEMRIGSKFPALH